MTRKPALKAPPAECPNCHGYGYVIEGTTARPCDCGLLSAIATTGRIATAGIPARFANKDFNSFTVEKGDKIRAEVRKCALAYADSFERGTTQGLLLRGSPGCGKTHIAVAILKETMQRGFSGYYTGFGDLLQRIRDTFSAEGGDSEGGLLSPLETADLVVLDDLGAESTTDWVRDRLYLIINRRYESAKATIITTNCDESELEVRVGPRTASRLYEMCEPNFPPFPRQDFRKAAMR